MNYGKKNALSTLLFILGVIFITYGIVTIIEKPNETNILYIIFIGLLTIGCGEIINILQKILNYIIFNNTKIINSLSSYVDKNSNKDDSEKLDNLISVTSKNTVKINELLNR